MTFSKAIAIATFTLGTSVSTFAQTATPYQYGMDLDIDHVISVDAKATTGHASTATLTYRDSDGQVQKVSYIRPAINANQN
ncbi:DUF2790 domain-containing protein [Pseudomonas sp. NPDC089554]|uniref:DUF2790 domain-containing protein n=1 Tax=Pseudomonas sp. NPDC089554 TaxID=3390653 RepID=UPI003D02489E